MRVSRPFWWLEMIEICSMNVCKESLLCICTRRGSSRITRKLPHFQRVVAQCIGRTRFRHFQQEFVSNLAACGSAHLVTPGGHAQERQFVNNQLASKYAAPIRALQCV